MKQVQARYKTHQPVSEDTLIFRARDYFSVRNRDPRVTAFENIMLIVLMTICRIPYKPKTLRIAEKQSRNTAIVIMEIENRNS